MGYTDNMFTKNPSPLRRGQLHNLKAGYLCEAELL